MAEWLDYLAVALLVVLLVLLPLLPSMKLPVFLVPQLKGSQRVFASLLMVPIVVGGMLVFLNLTFGISLLSVVLLGVGLSLAVVISDMRAGEGFRCLGHPLDFRSLTWPLSLILFAILFIWIRLYVLGSRLSSDDMAYHYTTVAGWMRVGRLDHPLIAIGAYYPYNPHLLAYYLTLPTGDTRWTWLANIYWLLMGVMAINMMGTVIPKVRQLPLVLASVLFLLSPTFVWLSELFSPTDLIGAIMLLSAVVFLFPSGVDEAKPPFGRLVLVGLLLGYAIGTKPTYLVPGGVLGLVALLQYIPSGVSRVSALKALVRPGAMLCGGVFLTGSYWYLRNLFLTGNPLFPIRTQLFSGPVRARHLEHTVMMNYIRETPFSLELWKTIFGSLLNWPLLAGLVAFAGLVGGLVVAGRMFWRGGRRGWINPLKERWVALLLAACAMLLMHIKSPFSASTLGGTYMVIYERYISFVYMAGLVLAATLASMLPTKGLGYRGVCLAMGAIVLYLAALRLDTPMILFSSVILTPVVALPFVLLRMRNFSPKVWQVGTAAVLLFVVLLAARESFHRPEILKFELHPDHEQMVDTLRVLESLPPGSRIAQFTQRGWESGQLYGRTSHLDPVFVDENGRHMSELHVAHREDRIGGAEGQSRLGLQELYHFNPEIDIARNLIGARVQYLLVSKYTYGDLEWPVQREIIRESNLFEKIWGDGYSELYAAPGFVIDLKGAFE